MTLANMRELGVHHLIGDCLNHACRQQGAVERNAIPGWDLHPNPNSPIREPHAALDDVVRGTQSGACPGSVKVPSTKNSGAA
jgi:hypothetical protein